MEATIARYWVEIVLSAISIVVGFVVGYLFYRLQKRDVASARAERVKRAREELLDVIESYIINKQTVSEESIHNLLAASEREYQVGLRDTCTPTTLLQDVALRLQKSRHLDIAQKREYADQIEQTITTIEDLHKEVPEEAKEPLELVSVLEDAIQNDEKQRGLETIALLKVRLARAPTLARAEYAATAERWQLIASLIAGVGAVIATLTLVGEYTGLWREVGIEVLAGVAFAALVAMLLTFFRRIRKRLEE